MVSNYIIAKLQLSEDVSLMAMINNDTTVIIVSHSIEQIERLCKHCVWLEKGKIKMIGDAAEVCDAYKNSQS